MKIGLGTVQFGQNYGVSNKQELHREVKWGTFWPMRGEMGSPF